MDETIDKTVSEFGFIRKKLPQDGSCLFRGIAENLLKTQHHHTIVRHEIVNFLLQHKSFFQFYIDENFDKYCNNLKKKNVWGGQVEIEAASQKYEVCIRVYSLNGIETEHHTEFKKKINLIYLNGNHYDLLYPKDQFEALKFCQMFTYSLMNVEQKEYKNVELDLWLNKGSEKKEKQIGSEILIQPILVQGAWGSNTELEKIKDKNYKENQKEVVEFLNEKEEEEKNETKEEKIEEEKDQKKEQKKDKIELEKKVEKKIEEKKVSQELEKEETFQTLFSKYKSNKEFIIISNYKQTYGYVLKKKENSKKWIIIDLFGTKKYKKTETLDLSQLYTEFGNHLYSKLKFLNVPETELDKLKKK